MKIFFFSYNLFMIFSLIRNKIFFVEYKHILVINYTLFNGMTTKLGEKKAKGEWKEQKTNVFPKRTYASVLDPPSHHFPFWSKLCELRHIDKILKNEGKQSET